MNTLNSGDSLTLADLFSGDQRKIIIPDLQRDYCWGDEKPGKDGKNELVTGFVESMIIAYQDYNRGLEEALRSDVETRTNSPENSAQLTQTLILATRNHERAQAREKTRMGLIYAYENPTHFLHLCDGQQRITTLYLLLGMLYRKVRIDGKPESTLGQRLISDYERKDDWEPYLQYAIRESTLYFLSDLVRYFFWGDEQEAENERKADTKLEVTDLQAQSWYFTDYNLDPSIQSMLSALALINKQLEKRNAAWCEDFGHFLCEQVEFLYFDLENRAHGEAVFVLINTTGKELTTTENLKPLLLGELPLDEQESYGRDYWEKWETYFWKNRRSNEHEADPGLKDFLTWYLRIRDSKNDLLALSKEFEGERIKGELESIEQYFQALESLCEWLADNEKAREIMGLETEGGNILSSLRSLSQTGNNPAQQNLLLPLLAYWHTHRKTLSQEATNSAARDRALLRVLRRLRQNHYDQRWSWRKDRYVDWRYVLQMVEASKIYISEERWDVSSFTQPKEGFSFEKKENVEQPSPNAWFGPINQINQKLREVDPNAVNEWEDHEDFLGDIEPLLKVAEVDMNRPLDISKEAIEKLSLFFETYPKVLPHSDKIPFSDVRHKNLFRLCQLLYMGYAAYGWVKGHSWRLNYPNKEKGYRGIDTDFFYQIWQKTTEAEKQKAPYILSSWLDEKLKEKFLSLELNLEGSLLEVQEDNYKWSQLDKCRRLWAILEYQHALIHKPDQELDYNGFRCAIGTYDELSRNQWLKGLEAEGGYYSMENLLLGATFHNNKSGGFGYQAFPLMAKGHEEQQEFKDLSAEEKLRKIRERSAYLKSLLAPLAPDVAQS